MVYVEKTVLLSQLISAALRHRDFQAKVTRRLPLPKLRQAVEDHLGAKRIPATVIDVQQAVDGADGAFEIVWQPAGGGTFQRQWFDIGGPPAREDAN